MIDPKMIPDEVVIAAGEGFLEADRVPSCSFDDAIRAAIAAGLAAWPGVFNSADYAKILPAASLILPLTQKDATDE